MSPEIKATLHAVTISRLKLALAVVQELTGPGQSIAIAQLELAIQELGDAS